MSDEVKAGTSSKAIYARADKWDAHMEKVCADAKEHMDVKISRDDLGLAEIADLLRAVAAERDALYTVAEEADELIAGVLKSLEQIGECAGDMSGMRDWQTKFRDLAAQMKEGR